MTVKIVPPTPNIESKRPRHIAIATKHLLAQRDKAVAVRDKATKEVEELTGALTALGWSPLATEGFNRD